jgi:GNAT superfamily N-acetyltransferase
MLDLTPPVRPSISRGTSRVTAPSVRRAQPVDLPALARLINRAHAVEAFFVDGDRVDVLEIDALRERGHFLILDGDDGELAGAVYVCMDGACGSIGLVSVAPGCQGRGLGRRLVAVAEALCAAVGCAAVELAVVNVRSELGPWYRSQGYREVGTAPFDQRAAKQPCHFIRMQKALAAS